MPPRMANMATMGKIGAAATAIPPATPVATAEKRIGATRAVVFIIKAATIPKVNSAPVANAAMHFKIKL